MARAALPPHIASATGTTADYLMQLRCDEIAGTTQLTDALGVRTFTGFIGPPGVEPAAMQNNTTIGARTFNGTTQVFFRSTVDSDHPNFQAANGGWGVACWVKPSSLAASGTIIELGEWSSPETIATNVQMRLSVQTDGSFRLDWEEGASVSRNNGSGPGRLSVGVWSHIGVRMRPDLDNINAMQIDFFHNGVNVTRAKNRPWPTDGSSARWIVGASRELGTAVGTPGNFYAGAVDDIIVTEFPPDVAWFRKLYADGARDFEIAMNGASVGEDSRRRQWSTYTRLLVQAPITEPTLASFRFPSLQKVDLEWVDITNINDIDFLESCSWGDSVDDFVSIGRARLFRNYALYNASPFSPTSTNKDNPFVDDTTGEHLLRSMRRVRIETAIVPWGMSKESASPYWEVMFDGFIRAVDVSDDFVDVTLGDVGVGLVDVFIEPNKAGTDRVYGSVGGSAIAGELQKIIDDNDPALYEILSVDDNGAANAIVITLLSTTTASTDVNGRGKPHHFNAGDTLIIAGTTNYNTPAGTVDSIASVTATAITLVRTTAGAFAVETVGTVRATGSLSYFGEKPALWTPVSSGWTVYQWNEPASKNVLQSLDEIASQIGWRVRFRWDDLRQQFRLAMFNPASASSIFRGDSFVYVLGVMSVGRLSTKVDDTRNVWVVEYPDNANKDPRTNRKLYVVSATDKTSIRTYGRRFARVRVASDSLVNRSNEAQSMADTALRDMSVPVAESQIEVLFDRRVQTQDRIDINYESLVSGPQIPSFFGRYVSGSCSGVDHSFTRGSIRTSITMRKVDDDTKYVGPVARVERYDDIISQTGAVPGRGQSPPASPLAPTVQNLGLLNAVRAVRVSWSVPGGDLNRNYLESEVHQSTTNGFTPSAATLAVVVRGTNALVTGMVLGTTYYVKVVHCDRMGNRSADSPQTAYVS